jgi:hypothetical protein
MEIDMSEELKPQTVWFCKVGVLGAVDLPRGADNPMRNAICDEFARVTGKDAEFCFSGWGQRLSELELAVVENRLPVEATRTPDPAVLAVVEALDDAIATLAAIRASAETWDAGDGRHFYSLIGEALPKYNAALAKLGDREQRT